MTEYIMMIKLNLICTNYFCVKPTFAYLFGLMTKKKKTLIVIFIDDIVCTVKSLKIMCDLQTFNKVIFG